MSGFEKPLEIALDCSTNGIASPKFVFKTSLTDQAGPKDRDAHQTNGFTSYVGTLAIRSSSESCNSSRRHSKIIDGDQLDQTSMNSFGSAASLSSNKSNKSKSTSSLNVKSKKMLLSHTLSNQETNSSPSSSPAHVSHRRHTHTPHSTASPSSRKQSRPKSVMSNFITRSLRVRKKSKLAASPGPTPTGTPILTDSDATLLPDDDDMVVSTLVSPIPVERKFTMSAVMHIYYTEAKQAQVYKSVLVSEKATTLEVIAQALERYNMKSKDPNNFILYEVIGKWQDVTSILPANMSFQVNSSSRISGATTSLPGLGLQSASPAINKRASVEEFVECYTRELSPEEHPYSAQFFLTTQEGFSRRFELRSKLNANQRKSETTDILHKASTASDPALVDNGVLRRQAMSFDDTNNSQMGIFGQTAHRRRARRNRLTQYSADAADELSSTLDAAILASVDSSSSLGKQSEKSDDTQQMFKIGSGENSDLRILGQEDEEIAITVNPLHPPDFAALTCSSPDSGVAFQKNSRLVASSSTKSSISSEQSEQKGSNPVSCGIYKAKLNTAFLLSLHLYSPEKEYLVHRLGVDKTVITSATNSDVSMDTSGFSEANSESSIVLYHPELAKDKIPVCCICRQLIKMNEKSSSAMPHQYTITRINNTSPLLINGQALSSDTALLRHGDLVSIGGAYLFMFQDYSSVQGEYIPDYNWKPLAVEARASLGMNAPKLMLAKSSLGVAELNTSDSISISGTGSRNDPYNSTPAGESLAGHWHQKDVSLSSESEVSVVIEDTDSNVVSVVNTRKTHGKSKSLSPPRVDTLTRPPRRSETEPAVKHSNSVHQIVQGHVLETNLESGHADQLSVDIDKHQRETSEVFEPSPESTPVKKSSAHRTVHTTKFKQICAIPKNRKLVFSFTSNEEDLLLDLIITKHDTLKSMCKLTPSYILAMCIEYSMMCNGQQSTLRFVQKAVDCIQEVVWVSYRHLQ